MWVHVIGGSKRWVDKKKNKKNRNKIKWRESGDTRQNQNKTENKMKEIEEEQNREAREMKENEIQKEKQRFG